tara:strand:+ start:686 stop:901 length:216 start_codon:yes stop_codon:yes gene_type:complete
MKEEFLKRLKDIDISVSGEDWFDFLLDTLPHGYEKGYLTAKSGSWNSLGGAYDEDFIHEVEEWCEWFKWSS